MRLSVVAILTLLVLTGPAGADDLDDMYNAKIAQYLAANPTIIKRTESPADVVRVWQDMVMVVLMIHLAEHNALPLQSKPQIVRRLDAAMSSVMRMGGYDDWQVSLLADITTAFARIAMDYGKSRVPYTTLGDARQVLTASTALARELEKKYAKPGAIIPPDPPITKW